MNNTLTNALITTKNRQISIAREGEKTRLAGDGLGWSVVIRETAVAHDMISKSIIQDTWE